MENNTSKNKIGAWNNMWQHDLFLNHKQVYRRFMSCTNVYDDILVIAKAMYERNKAGASRLQKWNNTPEGFTKSECLHEALELIGELNGQYELTEITHEQFLELLNQI